MKSFIRFVLASVCALSVFADDSTPTSKTGEGTIPWKGRPVPKEQTKIFSIADRTNQVTGSVVSKNGKTNASNTSLSSRQTATVQPTNSPATNSAKKVIQKP